MWLLCKIEKKSVMIKHSWIIISGNQTNNCGHTCHSHAFHFSYYFSCSCSVLPYWFIDFLFLADCMHMMSSSRSAWRWCASVKLWEYQHSGICWITCFWCNKKTTSLSIVFTLVLSSIYSICMYLFTVLFLHSCSLHVIFPVKIVDTQL